jgi:hypothetical protein
MIACLRSPTTSVGTPAAQLPEEIELQRIGVLELVHHEAVDAALQRGQYVRALPQQLAAIATMSP